MLTLTNAGVVAGAWALAAVLVWMLLVPRMLSATNFAWVNVAAAIGLALFAWISRGSQSDRSMSDILYDTEHKNERR
jgi:preprotein translocase subunit SecD